MVDLNNNVQYITIYLVSLFIGYIIGIFIFDWTDR